MAKSGRPKRPETMLFNVTADKGLIKRLKTHCIDTDKKIYKVFEDAVSDYLTKHAKPVHKDKILDIIGTL